MGTPSNPQLVVVEGDFDLSKSGAGILVVTRELIFQGNIDYDGLIMVIGKGSMIRSGSGNGTIRGGILIANIVGPDDVPGTTDDVLGASTLNTSGGGNSNIVYCSTAVDDAFATLPVTPRAFKDLTL